MVSRDAEGTGETRRPDPDQGAYYVGEVKFTLYLCGIAQACVRLRWIHRSGADTGKLPI